MTAVAATNMCDENITATTCHTCYILPVKCKRTQKHKEKNAALPLMSGDQQRIFRSRLSSALSDSYPVCTIIDECSMLTPVTLGRIIQRYGEIHELPLGAFIFVGDFFQIRPVGGTPIYKAMMEHPLDTLRADTPEAIGIRLLMRAKIFQLDVQQRSLHAGHTANILQMSSTDPSCANITRQLLACYPAITPEDIKMDPLWKNAPIVVVNNSVRHQINKTRLLAHAIEQRLPVLF